MVRGRKVAIVNLDEFDRAVQTISCAHILTRYEHLAEYANAQDLMNLDAFARKGNCQFAHNCRHRKPECSRNAAPDKIVFGIPKVPKLRKRDKDDFD